MRFLGHTTIDRICTRCFKDKVFPFQNLKEYGVGEKKDRSTYSEFFPTLTEVSSTLTVVFPVLFPQL